MSILSEKTAGFAAARWEARLPLLKKAPELMALHARLAGEAKELLTYLMATLPVQDLADTPAALWQEAVEEALLAREAWPWCQALPEHLFLLYLLCPRVNNEQLSPCRGLFRQELAPRVKGLSLPEAIQEVNRWCAGQVTYRSTDGRTASALDIYRRGWGRCGEESVFGVNALRSVGIAARQIYAPWWSHCDDNHAWVEAFDGEAWRFLGACEPEPRLDMGWFPCAASRAMLCHAKAFVGEGPGWEALFPGVSPLDLDCREGVAYESVTARYGKVKPFTVCLRNGDGAPVPGGVAEMYVLNEGGMRKIAQRVTDSAGNCALNLGLGSLYLAARAGEDFAEALVHTGESAQAVLTLGETLPQGAFDFQAPEDGGVQAPRLTKEERVQRREVLDCSKASRESRPAYAPEIAPAHQAIASTLTKKDLAGDIPAQALEESIPALQQEGGLPSEVFRQALLSPRVGLEPLAPWRKALEGALSQVPAQELWAALCRELAPAGSFPELPQTPAGAWQLGTATAQGLAGLYCALCRARGIPARLGADGLPEYWQDGGFRRADGQPVGTLTLDCPQDIPWSLARRRECCKAFELNEDIWQAIPLYAKRGDLPAGLYRLTTSLRLPNGNQLAWLQDFRLEAGESLTLTAGLRTPEESQLLQRLPLPELGFAWQGVGLLCWVRPGEEPTEHLLGELEPVRERLEAMGCGIHMICDGAVKGKPLPQGAELHSFDADRAELAARRMYLEPERLPLAILADGEGFGRFACAGYNVGTGELLLRLAERLKK